MSDGTAPSPDVARTSPGASRDGRGGEPEDTGTSLGGRSPFDRRTVGASTVLAAGVGVVAVLGLGTAAGVAVQAGVVTIAGLGLAGGVALLVDRDPVRAAVGAALSVLSACAVVVAVAVQYPVAMAALALAAFASPAIPLGSVGDDRVTDAAGTLVYALVPIGAFAGLAVAGRLFGPAAGLSAQVTAPTSVGANLTGFAILLASAAGCSLVALRSLPVVRLAPKRRRERVRVRYRRAESRLKAATAVAGLLVPLSVVVWGFAQSDSGLRSTAEFVASTTETPVVRVALLVVAVLALVVAVTVRTLRWAGGSVIELTRRGTAALVGVGLSVLAVPLAGPLYARGLEQLDPQLVVVLREFGRSIGPLSTVLLATLVAVILFVMALLTLPAVVGLGLAPDRTAAPAFAAAGVLGGSALVVDHVPAAVVLVGVVAAMVVWDLGEYGIATAEEVDAASATRAETVHAAGTLGVGALVTAGAVGVHAVVTDVSVEGATAVAGLAVAFVGIVLLAAVLRG